MISRAVEVGVFVKKGDLLARLDDQDDQNKLCSAEADVVAAAAVLAEADAAEGRLRQLLAGGKIPLKLALLSPAQRPTAITADISGFWKTGWPDARKDMRGRYPKHNWPEDGGAP